MNIDELTLVQIKQLQAVLGIPQRASESTGLNCMIGKKVIIRTYSAGVWFGTLDQKAGDEVIITNARRMWRWWAKESISLSAVAVHGVKHDDSKIAEPIASNWMKAIEIMPCTEESIKSLEGAPNAVATE